MSQPLIRAWTELNLPLLQKGMDYPFCGPISYLNFPTSRYSGGLYNRQYILLANRGNLKLLFFLLGEGALIKMLRQKNIIILYRVNYSKPPCG